jgi:hypothetical protein
VTSAWTSSGKRCSGEEIDGAAQRQGGLVTVKSAARGGHRGAGVRHANGTGARRRVTTRSCPMLSEACGGLSSAPGCSTKQRHDRRRWAAPDAEATAQRARTSVEAAWMGLGGAALELKDQRLGAARSGWRGWRRWRRSSSVGGSSNQRVEGGLGTAWGGLEARASASVRSSGLAGAAW